MQCYTGCVCVCVCVCVCPGCHAGLALLMQQCWAGDPDARPTMTAVHSRLCELLGAPEPAPAATATDDTYDEFHDSVYTPLALAVPNSTKAPP